MVCYLRVSSKWNHLPKVPSPNTVCHIVGQSFNRWIWEHTLYSIEPETVMLSSYYVLPFQSCFGCYRSFAFSCKFRTKHINFFNNISWNFRQVALNMQIYSERIAILKIWCLLTHEQSIILSFIQVFNFFFSSIIIFREQVLYIFVRFIPKNFIFLILLYGIAFPNIYRWGVGNKIDL